MNSNLPAILGGQPIFPRPIPFVRPALPDWSVLEPRLSAIHATGMLTKGPVLKEFEQAVASHLGVKHAIGVSSCTTGLMLTYQALDLTGEVIVPSFTFMATVSSLIWNGLTPVYADVDYETTNLCVEAIEPLITPRTSAIVGVHNFGTPANIERIAEIARRHQLKLIFDAAHGFGCRYAGRPVGGQGDAHVFSMSPTKLLVTGEGGIVSTNDDDLARKLRLGREYGNSGNYDSAFAGMNARLSEIHALYGLRGLEILDRTAEIRNEVASQYREILQDLPGLEFQVVRPADRSSYKDFSMTIDEEAFGLTRDQVATALSAEGVDTRKYYDPPVHEQTAYRHFTRPEVDLSNTILLARRSLSLPIGAQIDGEVVAGIGAAMRRIHDAAEAIRGQLADAEAPTTAAT